MKSRGIVAVSITFFVIVCLSSSQSHAGPFDRLPVLAPRQSQYVPGEVLVKYKTQMAPSAIAASLSQVSGAIKKRHAGFGIHHVKLSPHVNVDDALRAFRGDPSVEYAEPNYVRSVTANIPNDAFFSNQWGLLNSGQSVKAVPGTPGADIDAPGAWDLTTGNRAIRIAVIDSGIDYNHPDLAGNVSTSLGYDFVNNDGSPMDANDHGTHVAGTIAAVGNNGTGITGVCWTGTIMPLRAADAFGTLSVSSIVAAINYAIANGAKIINASYRGSDFSQAEYDAIDSARTAGVLLVAAAGNGANNNDARPGYPTSYPLDNIISVAATDQSDGLATFSNYGARSVHVAAPGVNIYSTRPARQVVWNTGFDDGSISDWTTGGSWGLSTIRHSSGSYSLAVSPAGNYPDNMDASAEAPPRDLSASVGSKLEFVFTGRSEAEGGTGYDFLHVETSTDGTGWAGQDVSVTDRNGHYLGTFTGGITGDLSDQWYGATVDLGGYDGKSTAYIRFHFKSDQSITDIGWFIDDIRLTAASSSYAGAQTDYYQYLSGTSMATPHVTGLAALIWGFKPGLDYAQVKDIILKSVDTGSSLVGKTVSGGRINVLNALFSVIPEAPGPAAAAVLSASSIMLTWSDNSVNESGFHIERKTGSGSYAQIAAVGVNDTTYSDAGLSGSTSYCYRVAAFNNGGNSLYSSETCAATLTPIIAGDTGGAVGGGGGGGCFIATAAFGSPMERHVHLLRVFRDRYLVRYEAGKQFMAFYYRVSPPIADVISRSDTLRTAVRWFLLPCVGAAYVAVHYGPAIPFLLMVGGLLFSMSAYKRLMRTNGRTRSGGRSEAEMPRSLKER